MGLMVVSTVWAQAQDQPADSALVALDTAALTKAFGEEVPMRWGEPYTPLKAGLLSAALPGLGQVYNGKAWKVPIVYLGLAGVGVSAWWNHQQYKVYRASLFAIIDDNPNTVNISGLDPYTRTITNETSLRSATDITRRNRDASYIGIGVVYLLAIAEANIDAHLSEFNLDDDLASNTGLQLKPLVVTEPNYAGVGVRLVFP